MTLENFAWMEIGVGLGLSFCLGMLLFNRRTQRRWLDYLLRHVPATPPMKGMEDE